MSYSQKEYNEDVVDAIKKMVNGKGTEGGICFFLYPKYEQYTHIFFNDAVRQLEYDGRIVRMSDKGLVWWEIANG